MSTDELHWGVDLGGTKIEGIVLGPAPAYKVLVRKRIPTYREKGYESILNRIRMLVDFLKDEAEAEPAWIGFGTPGMLDPQTGLIKNSNTTALNGQPLKRDLENLLQFPVRIANDANCFALAETLLGAIPQKMPEVQNAFGVIMGTGVGGGVVVNKQLVSGLHGIAGEWGHNFLHESGGKCYCGKTGCVETVISGKGLERYYFSKTGKALSLETISGAAGHDEAARETLERLYVYFGQAIARVINILDPEAIIIGGGVGNIAGLYENGPAYVRKYVFNNRLDTAFLRPVLGDSAGVFGAAML